MTEEARYDLLKKINSKLGWIVFLLVLITLNTCSAADRLEDLFQDSGDAPAASETAPAPTPAS